MAETRKWSGIPIDLETCRVIYCPDCGAPVNDTEFGRRAHAARVHALRPRLVRFATTIAAPEPRMGRPRGGNGDEDERFSCDPCRGGDHLLCDGGDCRCVCSLELDEPLRKHRAISKVLC